MYVDEQYDVAVIGAGHAGCEAALAAARLGCKTIVFTVNLDNIGYMPCNPAIGGAAKGQMVSELDALGGQMGVTADQTFIQMKVLNRSRGPAVQCLRAQSDKREYSLAMKRTLENQPLLDVRQAVIREIMFENGRITGVITELGKRYFASTVVITSGTFLKGKIHIGLSNFSAGRMGEASAETLSDSLKRLGLRLGRLKTGTTPRLDARSLDYTKMSAQPGDLRLLRFSVRTPAHTRWRDQVSCWLTYTTADTHKIILGNLDRSPMFQKVIQGVGPRYCPSIEDKVVRFQDKSSHQLFMEPEGRDTNEIYAQGLNTSLPEDVQEAFLRTIPGLETAKVLKPGYAVEYDFIFPDQLTQSLASKKIANLFFAGQINGTSGYEEAAGQGIVAGINAAHFVLNKPAFLLTRSDSYIGTMIDDLTTKNVIEEPYRMLSSRSEYRLFLRQDNAIFRLGERGREIGLLDEGTANQIRQARLETEALVDRLNKTIAPEDVCRVLGIRERVSYAHLLRRPETSQEEVYRAFLHEVQGCDLETFERSATEIKYAGYLEKQRREIEKLSSIEQRGIPETLDFDLVLGLKKESREKFKQLRPKTFFEAKRIAGINPTDLAIVMAYLER